MARWWGRRRRGSVAGWAVVAAAGLGTGAAVLALLEPGRRERARQALDRVGEVARDAGGRVSAFRTELPRRDEVERRPGLLGTLLVTRALLGGGILRIPFALVGLSRLARSERARTMTDAVTRAVRNLSAALRSYSESAAQRPAGPDGGAVVLGPDANPVT